MANYPVEWGWQADLEPDAGNQPRVIPLLPSILGGADPDVIQAAARMARSAPLSGPPTSGPAVSGTSGWAISMGQATVGAGMGPLMPNIEQFGFCLYLCPNGRIKRLGRRGAIPCQSRIPSSSGIDLEY